MVLEFENQRGKCVKSKRRKPVIKEMVDTYFPLTPPAGCQDGRSGVKGREDKRPKLPRPGTFLLDNMELFNLGRMGGT